MDCQPYLVVYQVTIKGVHSVLVLTRWLDADFQSGEESSEGLFFYPVRSVNER